MVEQEALDDGVVVRALSLLYTRARPRQGLLLGCSGYPAASIGPAVTRDDLALFRGALQAMRPSRAP
jgi:hypothetical protein